MPGAVRDIAVFRGCCIAPGAVQSIDGGVALHTSCAGCCSVGGGVALHTSCAGHCIKMGGMLYCTVSCAEH